MEGTAIDPLFSTVWRRLTRTDAYRSVFDNIVKRTITDYRVSITPELYKRLGITEVFERWKQADAVWLYKLRNSRIFTLSEYMPQLITFKKTSDVYNLRTSVRIDATAERKIGETTLAMRLKKLFTVFEKPVHKILSASSLPLFKYWLQSFRLCV